MELVVFWFRRDLRLEDNTGLKHALESGKPVLPVFIFDTHILDELPRNDARVSFIYEQLLTMHHQLRSYGSSLCVRTGDPIEVWSTLKNEFNISAIYTNEDYEPYARDRDKAIGELMESSGLSWKTFKDQVIFKPQEVLKPDSDQPYTIYTPYKNRWLERFRSIKLNDSIEANNLGFFKFTEEIPSLEAVGFRKSQQKVRPFDLSRLNDYQKYRDFPGLDYTSHLSVHLRFGTISIRQIVRQLKPNHEPFLRELIWREFFMQILFHFPHVVKQSFRPKYDNMIWRNDNAEFEKWKSGETGYPLVDAGMRELNETGYMHNRVRMVVASFLCKHLLIDWRWGEAYFAEKLLDYELSSNNGNWQWAAGTGCDAAPYFRVFNPETQQKKFDPNGEYVSKWVSQSIPPMVDHKKARERAIFTYKQVLN